jgi:hypothetical protein
MTATDVQVRIMMKERSKGCTQEQAAAKANLSRRKTASKYERLGKLPSELKQLRTLQRRVSNWRVLKGNSRLALDQVHQAGEVLQSDGTWMNDLGMTLQGEPFEHLVIHSVLPYSNWEWGRVVQSESLLAIRLGCKALWSS